MAMSEPVCDALYIGQRARAALVLDISIWPLVLATPLDPNCEVTCSSFMC